MGTPLNVVLLYAKDRAKTANFYEKHFGFSPGPLAERLIRLTPRSGGVAIVIHQAAKSLRQGHAGIKLVFDVEDVDAFKAQCAARGLKFGATHQANGYCYANAKDPDKNSISISSHAFRTPR